MLNLALIPTLLITLITLKGPLVTPVNPIKGERLLSEKEISLENRQADLFVNGVFKDNILLNMAYLSGKVTSKKDVNWEEIRKPFSYEFRLDQNKAFAFHEDALEQYQGKVRKTTNAHFNGTDGFVSDGYLMGDGICHLASLIYWTAHTGGLDSYAPTNHNFAPIPEIPREYGVSIYSYPGRVSANARQNLYILNNLKKDVIFRFVYQGNILKLSIIEVD